jgi:DNA-binding winged helix-turn-helix (wHTH) protein
MAATDQGDIFLFERFRLDRRGGGLFQRDENGVFAPVPIGQRALDVLGVLVERAGELVTRDDIIAAAWPETVVEDNNLNMQIVALRRVLDDGRTAPSSIQTIPRRGYRFIVPVLRACQPTQPVPARASQPREPDHTEPLHSPKSRPHYRARRAIMAGVVGALLLLAAATAAWEVRSRWLLVTFPEARLSIVETTYLAGLRRAGVRGGITRRVRRRAVLITIRVSRHVRARQASYSATN